MTQVVIVGYGMAGARCAADLARFGIKAKVLGAEPHRAYNRILLSNVLAGKTGEAGVELPDPVEDVRTGARVTAIARAERAVHCEDGEVLSYDHLVLATGADAWVPPIPGLTGELPDRVAVFRTLDDCRRILRLAGCEPAQTATGTPAAPGRTAIVLGGGLLGLEAARGLATRGLSVQVVHHVGHLMERQIDADASGILAETLTTLGITVHTGASTAAFRTTATGVALDLADGRSLDADLLVLACGVRPNVDLARAAGLAVERGVVVDDRLRTSDRHISAIGDCAEHRGQVGGLVAPAWSQASVVARVLSGAEPLAAYRPAPVVTRLKAKGIDLASMGTLSDAGPVEDLRFADPARGTYARLRIRDDRVTGAVLLGDNPSVGRVIQLFDRGEPVPADRRALLLGRSLGGAAADQAAPASPALMPDATTVCQCNTVSKGAIVSAWHDGCRDTAAIAARTRATTGCGTCTEAVCGISDWLAASEGVRG